MDIIQAVEITIMLMMIVVLLAALIGGIVSGVFLYREYNEVVTYPWERAERKEAKRKAKEAERARRKFWAN